MKKILLVLTFLISLMGGVVAQSTDQIFHQLAQSFEQADHQGISNVFDNTLEISIDHKDGTYGKQQATAMLRDFLSRHRPSGFTIKHTGASQGQSYYAVCEMREQMNTWQVYLLLNTGGKIIQLKINT